MGFEMGVLGRFLLFPFWVTLVLLSLRSPFRSAARVDTTRGTESSPA